MEICFVVQGSVSPSTSSLCVQILSLFPNAHVYLCHYLEDSTVFFGSEHEERLIELFVDDPGADFEGESYKKTNIKRMLATTYALPVDTARDYDFIIKLRSDLKILDAERFKSSLYSSLHWFRRNPKAELACLQNGTMNPFGKYMFPFHFNDWFYIVKSNRYVELKMYLDSNPPIDSDLSFYRNHAKPSSHNLKNYLGKYQAEQIVHFCDRFDLAGLTEGARVEEDTLRVFADYARNSLKVIPLFSSGLVLAKRPRGIGISHKFVTLSRFDIFLAGNLSPDMALVYFRLIGKTKSFIWHFASVYDRLRKRAGLID